MKFGADAELLQLLERAKELCAGPSSAEVIRSALKELIKKQEKALGLVATEKTRAEKPSAPAAPGYALYSLSTIGRGIGRMDFIVTGVFWSI